MDLHEVNSLGYPRVTVIKLLLLLTAKYSVIKIFVVTFAMCCKVKNLHIKCIINHLEHL